MEDKEISRITEFIYDKESLFKKKYPDTLSINKVIGINIFNLRLLKSKKRGNCPICYDNMAIFKGENLNIIYCAQCFKANGKKEFSLYNMTCAMEIKTDIYFFYKFMFIYLNCPSDINFDDLHEFLNLDNGNGQKVKSETWNDYKSRIRLIFENATLEGHYFDDFLKKVQTKHYQLAQKQHFHSGNLLKMKESLSFDLFHLALTINFLLSMQSKFISEWDKEEARLITKNFMNQYNIKLNSYPHSWWFLDSSSEEYYDSEKAASQLENRYIFKSDKCISNYFNSIL